MSIKEFNFKNQASPTLIPFTLIWIRNISIALVLLVLLGSCEKRFNNPLAKKYTIEGQLYEGYNFEPIKDYPLELVYYELNSRNQRVAQRQVDTYTTEGDGYFKFKYSKFSGHKEGFLAIQQDLSKRKSGQAVDSSPMLEGISLNADLNRGITIVGMGKLEVIIHYSELANDSFFYTPTSFRGIEQKLDFGHSAGSSEQRFPSYYGFLLSPFSNRFSFTGITKWDADLNKEENIGIIDYGLGRKDYFKSFNAHRTDSVDDNYNVVRFQKSGFPYIDTVYIALD